jgi:hypothetical protein
MPCGDGDCMHDGRFCKKFDHQYDCHIIAVILTLTSQEHGNVEQFLRPCLNYAVLHAKCAVDLVPLQYESIQNFRPFSVKFCCPVPFVTNQQFVYLYYTMLIMSHHEPITIQLDLLIEFTQLVSRGFKLPICTGIIRRLFYQQNYIM